MRFWNDKGKEKEGFPAGDGQADIRKHRKTSAFSSEAQAQGARWRQEKRGRGRRGSMTLECALVLPWFLFAMLAVLQFGKIQLVSGRVLAGMQDTVKEMAVYAYLQQLGITAGEGTAADMVTGGLSAAYAKGSVEKKAELKESDGKIGLWQSSFMQEDMLDLAVSYEARNTYTLLPIPKPKALLRARVRAWTGRDGNGQGVNEASGANGESGPTVFVAETGKVYHKDPNCTHIRLSVQMVSKEALSHLRNKSGGKYHACERCKGGTGKVYITKYGDRYHSSAGCSGLKRTVTSVPVSELEGWRACSKCGK